MTEQEFLDKVREMLPELNELIMKKAQRVFGSGAIEPSEYGDNYLLPKIFMSAMGKEIEWQYKPSQKRDVATRNNLANFL